MKKQMMFFSLIGRECDIVDYCNNVDKDEGICARDLFNGSIQLADCTNNFMC